MCGVAVGSQFCHFSKYFFLSLSFSIVVDSNISVMCLLLLCFCVSLLCALNIDVNS